MLAAADDVDSLAGARCAGVTTFPALLFSAAEGSVEAWGRSSENPVGGWYGLRNGYRGRFAMYLPPLLEELGLAEVTHEARNNRMRAL